MRQNLSQCDKSKTIKFPPQSFEPSSDGRKYHHRRHVSSSSLKHLYEGPMKHVYDSIELVPTSAAEASK